MYEHLSRPYLEKLKFLDRYIQPRKSYRGIVSIGNGSKMQYDMSDSLKSNSPSLIPTANVLCRLAEDFHKYEGVIKEENPDTDSHNEQSESYERNSNDNYRFELSNGRHIYSSDVAASTSSSHQNNQSTSHNQSTPPPTMLPFVSLPTKSHTDTNSTNLNSNSYDEVPNSDDESNENNSNERVSEDFIANGSATNGYTMPFPYNPPYNQNFPNIHNRTGIRRTSDELLGELVTTELMQMSGERKKSVQKRILKILFFEE